MVSMRPSLRSLSRLLVFCVAASTPQSINHDTVSAIAMPSRRHRPAGYLFRMVIEVIRRNRRGRAGGGGDGGSANDSGGDGGEEGLGGKLILIVI